LGANAHSAAVAPAEFSKNSRRFTINAPLACARAKIQITLILAAKEA